MHRRDAWGLALLWLLTAAVFWEGLDGQFVWDDFWLIVNNATLRDPSRLGELLTSGFWDISSSKADVSETYTHVYRPVVTLALFVQQQMFGLDAHGFHVVSLVLHLAVVAMVFGLLRRFGPSSPGGWLGALAGAALFALHPTRAESVAWISGSTELWMGLLVFAGYTVWVARPTWTIAAAMFFGLAIFAKETAIVIPAVLLVDMFARQGAVDWKRWGAATATFFAFVLTRIVAMPLPPRTGNEFDGLPRRVLATAGHYIEATVWPWQPLLARGFRQTDCSGALVAPFLVLLVGGVAVVAVLLLCLNWRALRGKAWALGIAWFVLFLAPVLNIVDMHALGLAGDRFLYVPLFGVAVVLTQGVARALDSHRSWLIPVCVGLATLLVACGISTRRHVAHFHDSVTLWHHEAEANPANPYALERVAGQEGAANPGRALAHYKTGYERAVEHCNPALAARFAFLATWRLLGTISDTDQERLLVLREFYDEVVETDRLSLEVPEITLDMKLPSGFAEQLKRDPSLLPMPHAVVTMRTLDLPRARAMVERVLEADPDRTAAWLLLARIRARQGDIVNAERLVEEARERAPGDSRVPLFAGTLDQVRQIAETRPSSRQSERIQQAQIQVLLQAPEAARRILQPELEKDPGNPALVLAYVRTVTADRRFDLARAAIEEAVKAAPSEKAKWDALRQAIETRKTGASQAATTPSR